MPPNEPFFPYIFGTKLKFITSFKVVEFCKSILMQATSGLLMPVKTNLPEKKKN